MDDFAASKPATWSKDGLVEHIAQFIIECNQVSKDIYLGGILTHYFVFIASQHRR